MLLLLLLTPVLAANRATVDQGIQQFQRGAYEKAVETFRESYHSESPDKNVFAAVSLFMIIKCEFELGNYDQVIENSRVFERIFATSQYFPDVLFERAKALAMKQQFYPAMLSAIKVLSYSQDQSLLKNVMPFCEDISRYYLSPSDLETLSFIVIGKESLIYLKLIWADRSIAIGNYTEANRLLQEVKTELNSVAYIKKYKEIIKYLNKSKKDESAEINIAIVLPLTGKYSETGNQLLEGIKYSYESNRSKSKKRVNIIIVDTESKIKTGLKNLKILLEMQNISAVIGPLTSDMAISMAPLCEYAGVPLITPTATADKLIDMGESIFQLNPEQQQRARVLADYATESLGYQRFAIVAPSTEYGIDISNAFTHNIEKNNGQVVYNVWYTGTPTNINDKLAEMKDEAEYMPPYFSYLKGFYEARDSGYFDIDTSTVNDSLLISVMDSIFTDSLAYDSLLIDSLYAISYEDTLFVPDTIFILETLWPDSTVYEILLWGTMDSSKTSSDTLLQKLVDHAHNWLSPEISLEEKYNTIISDSICVLLSEIDDNTIPAWVDGLLSNMYSTLIDSQYTGKFTFSRIVKDTLEIKPYINLELVDSLKIELAKIDSISALWVLSEVDTNLFPYIFPHEDYGIDAVYIPVPQSHIQFIAPQWAKNRFDAYLLGDGNWYQINILNRYRSNIDSMMIASDYYWDSKDIHLRRFVKYFFQKTNIQANRIHVYGYESMNVLMDVIENGGHSAREIQQGMSALKDTYGIIRRITFDPDHPRSSSGVRLIRYYKGSLKPAN